MSVHRIRAAVILAVLASLGLWYATRDRADPLRPPTPPPVDAASTEEEAARRKLLEAELARALESRLPPLPPQSAEGVLAAREAYEPQPAQLRQPELAQARFAEPSESHPAEFLGTSRVRVEIDPERARELGIDPLETPPVVLR